MRRLAIFRVLAGHVFLDRGTSWRPQARVRGRKSVAHPIFMPSFTGKRIATRLAIATSQSCMSGCLVLAKKLRITRLSSILPVSTTCCVNSSSKIVELDLGVWPCSSSQWAVAFITPSGKTSRGQA